MVRPGFNYRLDEPRAALGLSRLARLHEAIAALMAGRTVVHVTHLSSRYETPGCHVALDHGRLVSPGAVTTG